MMDSNDRLFGIGAEKRLHELAGILSPTMNEAAMAAYLRRWWSGLGAEVETDVMGNVHAVFNSDGRIHVGVCAHMDSVALQLTNILPCGAIQFRSIGLNPHVLVGQPVIVTGEKGEVEGVVGFDPSSQYGQPKGLVLDDLWIDIGARDADEAGALIGIGDLAVLRPTLRILGGERVCGAAIDDRIGLLIAGICLEGFVSHPQKDVCLHLIGSVQEEVGLRGAAVAAAKEHLTACFVIDVDYATDTPASHENQTGVLLLGKGVGLHVKSDNNPALRKELCKIADSRGIPYQISLGRFVHGGTDASPMQTGGGGTATANVSIPCRYMHSPVEICHKRDIEGALSLLCATIREIGERGLDCFIPF